MSDELLLDDPEQVLIARLQEALPDVPVSSVDDIQTAHTTAVGGDYPEILVMLTRETVADAAGDVTLVDLQYAAILCVPSNFPDRKRDFNLRMQMTKAVAGYEPTAEHFVSPFRRVGSVVRQNWPDPSITAYGMLFGVAVRI